MRVFLHRPFFHSESYVSSNTCSNFVSYFSYSLLYTGVAKAAKGFFIHGIGSVLGYYSGGVAAVATRRLMDSSLSVEKARALGRVHGQLAGSAVSIFTYMTLRGTGSSEAGAFGCSVVVSSIASSIIGSLVITCNPTIYRYDIENPRPVEIAFNKNRDGG